MATQKQVWDNAMNNIENIPFSTHVPEDTFVRITSYFEKFRKEPIRRALDIGCGYGSNTLWLLSKGYDVLAFDFAPTCIDLVQNRSRHLTDSGAKLRVEQHDLLNAFPTDWGKFDLMLEGNVIQHIPFAENERIFQNIYDALNPGGAFLGMMLSRHITTYPYYLAKYKKVQGENGSLMLEGGGQSSLEDIGYAHFYTKEELVELAHMFSHVEILEYSITLPSFESKRRIPELDVPYTRHLWIPLLIK
jgi:SAM-dependent methyltransferase